MPATYEADLVELPTKLGGSRDSEPPIITTTFENPGDNDGPHRQPNHENVEGAKMIYVAGAAGDLVGRNLVNIDLTGGDLQPGSAFQRNIVDKGQAFRQNLTVGPYATGLFRPFS